MVLFYHWVIEHKPTSTNKWLQKLYDKTVVLDDRLDLRFLIGTTVYFACLIFAANGSETMLDGGVDLDLQDKLAVLNFENQTGNEELDVIGPMVSHWLTEGFIQNGDVKIVAANAVQRAYKSNAIAGGPDVSKMKWSNILGTKYVIDGVYFLQGDSIFLKSNLVNVESGDIIYAFGNFSGSKDKPVTIIEDLREKVLGYWYNKDKIDRFPAPRFDAYEKYIQAISLWDEDDTKVYNLLTESYRLDTNFLEPQLLKVGLYRNKRSWYKCDSLINYLYNRKSILTKAQLDKLNFYRYDISGDFTKAYEFLLKEYERDEDDLFISNSVMQFANYKLNDARSCLKIAEGKKLDSIDFDNCSYCRTRLFNYGLALLKLGRTKEVEKLVTYDDQLNGNAQLFDVRLMALVKESKDQEIKDLMSKKRMNASEEDYLDDCIVLLTEYQKSGDTEQMIFWQTQAQKVFDGSLNEENLFMEYKARILEISGAYKEAQTIWELFLHYYPDNAYYNFRLATVMALRGDCDEAIRHGMEYYRKRGDFDFGYSQYEMARIHSLCNEKSKALGLLSGSLREGRQFHYKFFDRDWYLKDLWDDSEFKAIIKYRVVGSQ